MNFLFGSGFLDFERKLNWLWQKPSSIVVKTACYVSRGTILGIVLGQIRKVFDLLYFIERKVSRKCCQNCFSWLHRIILGRKFFFNNKKNFCHFQTSSQKFMDCFQKKFLPVLSKQHSAFREKQFEAKWCFWKEYIVLLFMFSGRLKKKLGVWWNSFGMYVKNYLFVSKTTFLENTVFLSRTKLLTFSGNWSMVFGCWQKVFGRRFPAEIFWQDFPDCNGCLYGNVFNICLKLFRILCDVPFDFW